MSILNSLENVSWEIEDFDKANKKYVKDVVLKDMEWIDTTGGGNVRVINSKPLRIEKIGEDAKKSGSVEVEEVIKDEYFRDDLKDLCAYLTTALGFGNYWLILDEIDKVEEMDTDKFAPLLHIVRERTLKNFSLVDINDGKGLGIPLGKDFKKGGYQAILGNIDRMLDAGESVLDTRVMAIANQTENIEDALFRRFIQIISEEVLIWREGDLTIDETNVEKCLTDVKSKMRQAGLAGGSLTQGLMFQKLDEINLQWQYNFFPKMLNNEDTLGNYFKMNAFEILDRSGASSAKDSAWIKNAKHTAFYKILKDNYREYQTSAGTTLSVPNELFNCLQSDLVPVGDELGMSAKSEEENINEIQGILRQKEADGLNHEDVAFEIAENIRGQYPKKEKDKLKNLVAWTENIIDYLRGSIFHSPTEVMPLNVSKHLIPALLNVFYTEIAADSSNIPDNVVSVTQMIQSFFKGVFETDPTFSYECDLQATREALYGGTEKQLADLDESGRKKLSPMTLFGADKESWLQSASGGLTRHQMQEGLTLSFPVMVKELGFEETAELFVEHDGAMKWLSEYYSAELNIMSKHFKEQSKTFKDNNKTELALIFKQSYTLINIILSAKV
jgi:hypothetical protein